MYIERNSTRAPTTLHRRGTHRDENLIQKQQQQQRLQIENK